MGDLNNDLIDLLLGILIVFKNGILLDIVSDILIDLIHFSDLPFNFYLCPPPALRTSVSDVPTVDLQASVGSLQTVPLITKPLFLPFHCPLASTIFLFGT